MTKAKIVTERGITKDSFDTRIDAHDSHGAIGLLRGWVDRHPGFRRQVMIMLKPKRGGWITHRDES